MTGIMENKKIVYNKKYVNSEKNSVLVCDAIVTLLLCIFITFTIAGNYWSVFTSSTFLYLGYIIVLFAVMFAIISHPASQNFLIREISFYTVIAILYIMSTLWNNNSAVSYIIWNFRYILAAMAMSRIKLWIWPVRILFFGLSGYFILQMYNGVYSGDVVIGISRNIISVHLILLCVMYILALKDTYPKRTWIPVIISLYITVWTGSRSGILALSFLLIGIFWWIYTKQRKRRKPLIFSLNEFFIMSGIMIAFISVVIVAVWFILRSGQVETYLFIVDRKKDLNPLEDLRVTMITEYLLNCTQNIGNLIFGAPFNSVPVISALKNNPHNSFLFAYGNYGLLFLILILYHCGKAVIRYFQMVDIRAILLIAITIRAFFDITAFYGIFDILFYYLVYEVFIVDSKCKGRMHCLFRYR